MIIYLIALRHGETLSLRVREIGEVSALHEGLRLRNQLGSREHSVLGRMSEVAPRAQQWVLGALGGLTFVEVGM